MKPLASHRLGATLLEEGQCSFLLWAPKASQVDLKMVHPREQTLRMQPLEAGYFGLIVDNITPETKYVYRLNDAVERPDPASRFQPEGVHGPSQVVESQFDWHDTHWRGVALRNYILYELHVGTFTPEGTFDSVIPHLDDLVQLGITVVELMPIGQFPGSRNWGYDGVYAYAPQNSYGGPDGLRRLVDACHLRGLAVALDVVYNHLGPEGNYLEEFGHYFTDKYRTPWGRALNFDDRHSDQVRRYFIDNAVQWIDDFHIDSLRLDAVHAIFDESARPFLRELGQAVLRRGEELNRHVTVIAESNKNDSRQIERIEMGGYGLDAVWNDDYHHGLHVALTGERDGYYNDFDGLAALAKAYEQGFALTGQYSATRGRRHGVPSRHLPTERFVICGQNHDQIGNRAQGERFSSLVDFESLKLAAATVVLAAGVPLLFMGEEYGETAPFLYFVSHSDQELIDAVRRGRREEFQSFAWKGEVPDPQAEDSYRRSQLDRRLLEQPRNKALRELYGALIRLRKAVPALNMPERELLDVNFDSQRELMCVQIRDCEADLALLFHFGRAACTWSTSLPAGHWSVLFDTADPQWAGPGSAIPKSLDTDGELTIRLCARQAIVFQGVRRL